MAREVKIVRAGQRVGSIRSDVDAPTLAVRFLGLVQPAVMLGYLSDGRFDATRHAKRVWKLLVETTASR